MAGPDNIIPPQGPQDDPDHLSAKDMEDKIMEEVDPVAFRSGLTEDASLTSQRVFAIGGLVATLGREAEPTPETRKEPTYESTDFNPYSNQGGDERNRIYNEHMAGTAEGKIAGVMGDYKGLSAAEVEKRKREEAYATAVMTSTAIMSAQKLQAYQDSFGGGGMFGEDWKQPEMTYEEYSQAVDGVTTAHETEFKPAAAGAAESVDRLDREQFRRDNEQIGQEAQTYLTDLSQRLETTTDPAERAQLERTIEVARQYYGIPEGAELTMENAQRFRATSAALMQNERWVTQNRALIGTAQQALGEMVTELEAQRDSIGQITTTEEAMVIAERMQTDASAFISGIDEQSAVGVLAMGLQGEAQAARAEGNTQKAEMLETTAAMLSETDPEQRAQLIQQYEQQIEQLRQAPGADDPTSETGQSLQYMESMVGIAKGEGTAKEFMQQTLDAQNAEIERMAAEGDVEGLKAALQARSEQQLAFTQNAQNMLTQTMESIDQSADITRQLYEVTRERDRLFNEAIKDGNITEAEQDKIMELTQQRESLLEQFTEKREELGQVYDRAKLALENDVMRSYVSEETLQRADMIVARLERADRANQAAMVLEQAREHPGMLVLEGDPAAISAQLEGAAGAINELKATEAVITDDTITQLSTEHGLDQSVIRQMVEQEHLEINENTQALIFSRGNDLSNSSIAIPLFGPLDYNETLFSPVPISQTDWSTYDPAANYGVYGGNQQCFADSDDFHKYDPPPSEDSVTPSYNKPWYESAWDTTTDFMASIFGSDDPAPATTPSSDPLNPLAPENIMLAENNNTTTGAAPGNQGGSGGTGMA